MVKGGESLTMKYLVCRVYYRQFSQFLLKFYLHCMCIHFLPFDNYQEGSCFCYLLMCRKLLLNTVLLCAAAEAGDYGEVLRLLSSTGVSPNARGLRHKNSLHLAASKGHKEIVEFLLVNGVS